MSEIRYYKGKHKVKVLTESRGYWIVEALEPFEDSTYGRKVKVKAGEAYGEIDREAFVWVPREDFPETIPLEVGTVFEMREENGNTHLARITEVGEEQVHVDLNHPLAGKELSFDVKIVEIREATSEELEHGHFEQPRSLLHQALQRDHSPRECWRCPSCRQRPLSVQRHREHQGVYGKESEARSG